MSSNAVDPYTGTRYREFESLELADDIAVPARNAILSRAAERGMSVADTAVVLASLGLIPDDVGYRHLRL